MNEPQVHLPSPSVWPFVLGAGVTLAAFGVVVSLFFTVAGVALIAWALMGWIADMRHE